MKTLLKVLLAIAGLVVALAIVLATAVALLFDPRDYQPLLIRSVESATGRSFTLQGELGLDVFPCCAVTLERAALGNPPGFPAGEFARVESAELSLRLWPLIIRREVQIGRVRLQGLDLALQVRADGATSWSFASEEAGPHEESTAAQDSAVKRLAIEGVEIRGGRIAYRDEQAGSEYVAGDIELKTGDLAIDQPFDLQLSARITDRADATTGTVTLQSGVRIHPGLERYTLENPRFGLAAAGGAIPAKSLDATLTAAALDIDAATELRGQFRSLQLEFTLPELASPGDLTGRLAAAEATMGIGERSEVRMPALDLTATLRGKDIPGDGLGVRATAKSLVFDVGASQGSCEEFVAAVEGLGAKLDLRGSGRFAGPDTRLAGTLRLDPVSPRRVLELLAQPVPATSDPAALTQLGGSAEWTLGEDALQLSKLDFMLDQSRIRGSFGLEGFEQGMTRFDLQLDAIDLDRYSAPETAASSEGQADDKAAADASAESEGDDIPVDSLRDLRLEGRLAAGALTFSGLRLTDLRTTVHADAGRLRLDPLAAKLYGGEYRGTIEVDARGEVAKLALAQQLRALQVGPLLRDLYQSDRLGGALGGRADLTGTGNTGDDLLRSLDGTLALELTDGVYLGTDVWHEIRSARARIKGEAPPPAPSDPRTPIEVLQFAGQLDDGVLQTERLLAGIPFIRFDGAGRLDLVAKTLDMHLKGQVHETPVFEDGLRLEDLTGIAIPLTLRGPLDKPKVGVDLKDLVTGVATQKLRERLLKKLGDDEAGTDSEEAPPDGTAPAEEKPRDILKRSLRDLLRKQ